MPWSIENRGNKKQCHAEEKNDDGKDTEGEMKRMNDEERENDKY